MTVNLADLYRALSAPVAYVDESFRIDAEQSYYILANALVAPEFVTETREVLQMPGDIPGLVEHSQYVNDRPVDAVKDDVTRIAHATVLGVRPEVALANALTEVVAFATPGAERIGLDVIECALDEGCIPGSGSGPKPKDTVLERLADIRLRRRRRADSVRGHLRDGLG